MRGLRAHNRQGWWVTEEQGTSRISALRSAIRLLAFAAAFLLTYVVLILLPAGQDLDSGSFDAATLPFPAVDVANVYRVVVPIAMIAACVALGIRAIVQRRVAVVITAVAIVVPSVLVSEALKLALPRPDFGSFGYPQNTYPSGHVALALSSFIALVVLAPPERLRWPVVGIAGLLTVGVSWASVVSFAHRPSDVIGSSLLVGLVTSAVLWRRRTVADSQSFAVLALSCAAACGALLVGVDAALRSTNDMLNTLVAGPGWFLLCVMPAVLVIGLAPSQEPARLLEPSC